MKESLEVSANTVEEAIQRALEQLGVEREAVEVSVVREGKHGILGLGSAQAMVRVRLLEEASGNVADISEVIERTLERLLDLMGVDCSVVPGVSLNVGDEEQDATTATNFEIEGDDLGILIGRRGQTIACLQYIVRLIVGHQLKQWLPIVIDVEGYKKRRYQALQALARNIAEQVRVRGTPFTLEPMPAYERRIIHLTLADEPGVTTESTGQGESRKVVVSPESS